MQICAFREGDQWLCFVDFIEFLEQKAKKANKAVPKFGSAKGMFVMHDDFDEPLEDFKDYM